MSQAILRASRYGDARFSPPDDSSRFIQYALGATLVLALLAALADGAEPAAVPAQQDEPATKTAPPRERRILFFSAKWCGPCRAVKGDLHDPDRTPDAPCVQLLRAGWKVGAHESDHIQIVDVDQSPELSSQYGVQVLPSFVLVDSGEEVRRLTGGAVDEWDLAILYKGFDERLAQRASVATDTP